ncbi:ANTAR domain-containing protein [Streptomyces sp. NBC_01190]|uniref:ANTAR domain-containing protein n=1 Tax=Streptomyces sp. NBC_01190 TaxID=2903767 RepID=UPI0038665B70|nr:ANTAR domain-containing protein [Streptomyces sp. NBC_01190]
MESGPPEEGGERDAEQPRESGTGHDRRFTEVLAAALDSADLASVPARLCQVCVDLLDVTGASVSLVGDTPDAGALWWSSDPVAAGLAEAQYSLGDGPCRTARELLAPVLAADLTGADAGRWPVFAQRAVEMGVRAVFSLPLGSDVVAIGSLDLYRRGPGPLSRQDTARAFTASDAITAALIRIQSHTETDDGDGDGGDQDEPASWLNGAESDHHEVHYATGMLMVRLGVGPQHALARLRAYAFARGRTVTEAARDVLARRADFDE